MDGVTDTGKHYVSFRSMTDHAFTLSINISVEYYVVFHVVLIQLKLCYIDHKIS